VNDKDSNLQMRIVQMQEVDTVNRKIRQIDTTSNPHAGKPTIWHCVLVLAKTSRLAYKHAVRRTPLEETAQADFWNPQIW